MSRVVVTGACGRFGHYVAPVLAAHHEVETVDIVPPPGMPDLPFQLADVLDRASLDRAFAGRDAVVHLAGRDLSTGSAGVGYLDVNVTGTWNVCQAALAAGATRMVHISSIAALGLYDAPGLQPRYLPIDESHPLMPVKPYGLSKQLSEVVTAGASRTGMDVVCLRLPVIAFPGEIEQMRRAARALDEPRMFCYVAPEDAARAVVHALDRAAPGWSVFNIAASDSYLEVDTLKALATVHGEIPEVRRPARFDSHPRASVLDTSLAASKLGFSPAVDWPQLSGAAAP